MQPSPNVTFVSPGTPETRARPSRCVAHRGRPLLRTAAHPEVQFVQSAYRESAVPHRSEAVGKPHVDQIRIV
jgi:hypothetical protein